MKKLFFFLIFNLFWSVSYSDILINPFPNSGKINLDLSDSSFIYLTNNGTSPVLINLTLSNSNGFSISPLDRCSGKNLKPKNTCYLMIQTSGKDLSIGINTSQILNNGINLVNLEKTKIQNNIESLSVSTNSINYGSLTKFGTSKAKSLTITNTGNSVISPVFTNSSEFSIVLNRCQKLQPQKSCSLSLALNPKYQIDKNGVFQTTVEIKPSSLSASSSSVILTSELKIPPAAVAYNNEGGICPSGKHFDKNICVEDSVTFETCQQILAESSTPPVSGYFDLFINGNIVNAYCEFSNNEGYTEIFNTEREPLLTDAQIVAKINKFTDFPLTVNNIKRDSSGRVMWTNSGAGNIQYSGQSLSIEKIKADKIKLSLTTTSFDGQGFLNLSSSNQNGCNPDTTALNSCFDAAFKNQNNQPLFLLGDSARNGATFLSIINGNSSGPLSLINLTDYVLDKVPETVHLTRSGRFEDSFYFSSPEFYFSKLLVKSRYVTKFKTCEDAKQSGKSSGNFFLDSDGLFETPPFFAFCDMSFYPAKQTIIASSTCKDAYLNGQKNVNNTTGSGVYSLALNDDFNNLQTQYCDMSPKAWNNNQGGYTLVAVVKNNNSVSSGPQISSLSDENKYINNEIYQKLISKSSEIVVRTGREDSSEIVFKVNIQSVRQFANCNNHLSSLMPAISYLAGSTSTYINQFAGWFWGESDCNFNGGDYAMISMRNDFAGSFFGIYSLSANAYIYTYNWVNGLFELYPHSYQVYPKDPYEYIYIYLK